MFLNSFKKILFVSLIFIFLLFQKVDAATLWIESNTSNIKVGDTVIATVYVSAGGDVINNVEAQLSATNFQIQSINNSGSILNMWVEQPAFTLNSASLNGGVLNPGYSGTAGKVVSISLKATKEGVGALDFKSASVRANDGLGTDVLKTKKGLTITIASNVAPVIEEKPINIPQTESENRDLRLPIIYSSATPDSEKWYNTNNTTFSWSIPTSATALKTLLGSYPDSEPTVLYEPVIQSRSVSDIPDGVWYFHLKYKTNQGWSKTAHKKIKIDTTPLESISIDEEILDPGIIKLKISAFDKTSYVEKIIISTSEDSDIEILDISKEGNAEYVFPSTYQGLKDITIKAFDSANNVYEKKFSINFPKVSVPIIETYPSVIKNKDEISIIGKSQYPNSKIELKIFSPEGIPSVYVSETREDGSFSFLVPTLDEKGVLSALVQVYVGDSKVPISSEKINIHIKTFAFGDFGQHLSNNLIAIFLSIILILIVVVCILIFKNISDNPERERKKKIKRVEKDIIDLIDSLKNLIVEDIHLISADRSIKDMEEAEDLLLKNLLADFKDIQKRITSRLKRGRTIKRRIEVEED